MDLLNIKDSSPVITVALPAYNSKGIIWLAIESLIRQEKVTFDWELIIIEEKKNGNTFKDYEQYVERLEDAGCTRFVHIGLDEWLPLPQKWKRAAELASETSVGYILHAADCYSQPNRLQETYKFIVENGFDWFDYRQGIFYNILTKEHIVYHDKFNKYLTGLNMATRTRHVRNLPLNSRKKGIDGWMYRVIKPRKVKKLFNNSNLNGCDTDGFNNISKKRRLFYRDPENAPFKKRPFISTNEHIENRLPSDIVERLYEMYETYHNS